MEADTDGTTVSLLVLEPKSLRPFKTKDEYLYAMKEDLAEWFKRLYEDVEINAENFLEILETGVLLCVHANEVNKFANEQRLNGGLEMKSNFLRDIHIPHVQVLFRVDVKPGTFLARDNISNFIAWSRQVGIPEVLRFETDDLVLRKNERSVVLCLLEVARIGAKFGMLAPTLVQMEEEIDAELAGDPPPQIKTCDVKSLDEMVRELVGRCSCPVQFPIIKVGEGKYKIGDSQTLVFVRILRKHVMIRVGGGWDTLEHYLDRHDPCRCNFAGHRGSGQTPRGGPTTPRRSSTPAMSQSLPNTPRTPRKMSVVVPPRPASPSMRSASPGPGSRKLPQRSNTNSQSGSTVTSPGVIKQPPNFPVTGSHITGNIPKQQKLSAGASGSPVVPKTPRRSQSPVPIRRSQSPAPRCTSPAAGRLRSPSPVPSNIKAIPIAGGQGQTTTGSQKGCSASAPVRQVSATDVRNSLEGKLMNNTAIKRQTSVESNHSDMMEATPGSSSGKKKDVTMEQISTMSLSDFKNLLNNALSVPNGTGSQGSSESPRSQSSTDSYRNQTYNSGQRKTMGSGQNVSSNRPSSARRNVANGLSKTSNVDGSSSGYSSSSVSSEKSKRSYSQTSSNYGGGNGSASYISRPRTPSGVARPTTPVQNRTASQTSKAATNPKPSQPVTNYRPSTPTNRSKLQPSASVDSSLSQTTRVSSGTVPRPSTPTSHKAMGTPRTPVSSSKSSSISSISSQPVSKSSVSEYGTPSSMNRSNSYTPCCAAEDRVSLSNTWAAPRASSEPRDTAPGNNVGYATFYHHESVSSVQIKTYDDDEDTSDIENEIQLATRTSSIASTPSSSSLNNMESTSQRSGATQQLQTQSEQRSEARPSTPSLIPRPSTPSLIPRPSTPKLPVKRKVEQTKSNLVIESKPEKAVVQKENKTGRPPTPRKSNIIARSPSSTVTSQPAANAISKEKSYTSMFQQKRSVTPSPGNRPSTPTCKEPVRRANTPGPNQTYSSGASSNSRTIGNNRLNQTLELSAKEIPLSEYNKENNPDTNVRSRTQLRETTSSTRVRTKSAEPRTLTRQFAQQQDEGETVIMVNRASGQHTLNVKNRPVAEQKPQPTKTNKVLARARTESAENRNAANARTNFARQRPQSVDPQAMRRRSSVSNGSHEEVAIVKRKENGQHVVSNRTEQWVESTAAQVQRTAQKQTSNALKKLPPRPRRAMTPNSFDVSESDLQPGSLNEIKAALTLPINGLNASIDAEQLEAPPEDPEMFATMERLFHALREKELKASVNETPGSATSPNGSVGYSDTDLCIGNDSSLDCNKNLKRKHTPSSRNSSSVTSPVVSNTKKSVVASARPRTPSFNRSESNSSVSTPRATTPRVTTPRATPPRSTPPRCVSTPPRPSTPTKRLGSKSSDDSVFETDKVKEIDPSTLVSKIKEIKKTNPRKDVKEGPKSRIPAPASLSKQGRSKSFSNLSNLSKTMSYSKDKNGYYNSFDDQEVMGYSNGRDFDEMSVGTQSSRSETPAPKLAMPLTTGRSTLRKENSTPVPKLVKAVSVERNIDDLPNSYLYYHEGEYV